MGLKLKNNAVSTLAAGIGALDLSLTVATGEGSKFPVIGVGDYFPITLIKASNDIEIVRCTARTADVLTIVREQESTTALTFSIGDRVELRMTAATFDYFYSPDNQGSGSGLDADTVDGRDVASANVVSTLITRDSSGNFAAGTMTGALAGNASTATLATTATNQTGGSVDATTLISDSMRQKKATVVAENIDLSIANVFKKVISALTTFTVSNVPVAGTAISFIIELTNGGSQTVNWFAGAQWASGVAPTLTVAGTDLIEFTTHDGGTTWFGRPLVLDSQ